MKKPPALEMQDVHRFYGSLPALCGVSFTVPEGEVFGLLGPNGAGKTTTIRLLTGQLRPHGGRVRVLGLDPDTSSRELSVKIGVVLEEPGHYERLPLRSNLTFFARLYGAPPGRVDELLELVGLQDKAGEPVSRLSRGMRQRLALARALVGSPRLLFLDEPTAGLDPHAARGVRSLIEEFCRQQGTVFLTTHFMEEAEELCHQVGILDQGRLVALGNPQDLCRESLPEQIETIRGGRKVLRPPGLEELFIHLTGRSLD
jgi:ABC-2 type transport system ATP-binding protein